MIRKATKNDLPKLIDMGRMFFHHAGLDKIGMKIDPGSLERLIEQIARGTLRGICLVYEASDGTIAGSIAGILHPWMLCQEQLMATELWWWVAPEYRGSVAGMKLLKEFIEWARTEGGTHVFMIAIGNTPEEAMVKKIYEKRGFQFLETHYILEVTKWQ